MNECECPAGVCNASPLGRKHGKQSIISDIACRDANTKQMQPPRVPASAPDLLARAEKHMRDRAATYDKPEGERSMALSVEAFNKLTGHTLTESQGWTFMLLLKLVRDQTRPVAHADSIEDSVAYCALRGEARLAGR